MGFGSSGFGSSPYGLGTPSDTDPNGGAILRNAFTAKSQGSRRINPYTRDYVLDAFGRIEGMDTVQQLVLLAVSTELGSSSMTELGHDLKSIDRITTNFERRVDSVLREALAQVIADRLVEVQGIKVTRLQPQGRAFIQLVWRDLTSGEEHLEEIGK